MARRRYKDAIEVTKTEEPHNPNDIPTRVWSVTVHRECFEDDVQRPPGKREIDKERVVEPAYKPGNWEIDKEKLVEDPAYKSARCKICGDKFEFDD